MDLTWTFDGLFVFYNSVFCKFIILGVARMLVFGASVIEDRAEDSCESDQGYKSK